MKKLKLTWEELIFLSNFPDIVDGGMTMKEALAFKPLLDMVDEKVTEYNKLRQDIYTRHAKPLIDKKQTPEEAEEAFKQDVYKLVLKETDIEFDKDTYAAAVKIIKDTPLILKGRHMRIATTLYNKL